MRESTERLFSLQVQASSSYTGGGGNGGTSGVVSHKGGVVSGGQSEHNTSNMLNDISITSPTTTNGHH